MARGGTVSIRVEVNAEKASAALAAFARASFFGLMTTLGALVTGQTKRRIAVEKRSPDGTPWKPLSALTIAGRRKGSSSPLTDTGRLLGSIDYTAGARSVVVGTNVFYAGFHQDGVKSIKPKSARALAIPMGGGGFAFAKETSIPARPFMGISAANMIEIKAAVNAWLDTVMT